MKKWKRHLRVNQVRYSVVGNCLFCVVHCLLLFGMYIIIPPCTGGRSRNVEGGVLILCGQFCIGTGTAEGSA